MKLAALLSLATLLGCGPFVCKPEQGVLAARLEAYRENAASVERATAAKLRERGATRLDVAPVVLSTQCGSKTPPPDDKGTFEGWSEPIPIRCSQLAPSLQRGAHLEAVTASGKRVFVVHASLEGNEVTAARLAPDRLLFFRALRDPRRMHVRKITQCGRCSGISDAWTEGLPDVARMDALVVERQSESPIEWVELPYDGFDVNTRCEELGPQ